MKSPTIAFTMMLVGLASTVACTTDIQFRGSGGSGGSGASGGNGGNGGNDVCSAFKDGAGEGTVTLRVQNDTGIPIYLPTSCGKLMPTIEHIAEDDPTQYVYDDSCLSTCEDLQSGDPIVCTAEACALITLLIEPGQHIDVAWDGTGLTQTEMPAACFADASYGPSCSQIVSAPSGSYAVDLRAYDSCANGPCQCQPDGTCFDDVGGLEAYPDPAVIEYPADDLVTVTFSFCAFGCPEN
jgi:hypothetical protein